MKVIKDKVVGKPAKKATLVADDDEIDSDPCKYEALDGGNKSKSPKKGFKDEEKKTTRIWTPAGPVLVDEAGNRIPEKTPGSSVTVTQDENDDEESPVGILSDMNVAIDVNTAIMDPDAEGELEGAGAAEILKKLNQ